jgi:hypothetical protein
MKDLKLLNYTSTVPPEKSIAEIERLLARAGATKIAKDYAGDGSVVAFFFAIPTTNGPILFRMPCDVERVFEVLIQDHKRFRRDTKKKIREQANRVAWRILLDWIESQIAMIRLNQVKPQQAFLAYAYDPRTQQTLFERIEENGFKMLGAGDQ